VSAFPCVVLSCVGSCLATGWSPVQGVLPNFQKYIISFRSQILNRNRPELLVLITYWTEDQHRTKISNSPIRFIDWKLGNYSKASNDSLPLPLWTPLRNIWKTACVEFEVTLKNKLVWKMKIQKIYIKIFQKEDKGIKFFKRWVHAL
jgi:hypothetical protein